MKKFVLLLAVAAFVFSPLAVSTAQAGPGKHAKITKHAKHTRHLTKHQRQHHGKHNAV